MIGTKFGFQKSQFIKMMNIKDDVPIDEHSFALLSQDIRPRECQEEVIRIIFLNAWRTENKILTLPL